MDIQPSTYVSIGLLVAALIIMFVAKRTFIMVLGLAVLAASLIVIVVFHDEALDQGTEWINSLDE